MPYLFLFLYFILFASSSSAQYVANNATLVKLTSFVTSDGAVSLDGSPAAIYIKIDKEINKFVLLQKGGAWCTSIGDCYSRSKTTLGSTNNYPTTVDLNLDNDIFGGEPFPILSNNQSYSPQFWNWTKIYLPYTDGGSQVGNLNDPIHLNNNTEIMYFRGYRILTAIQNYLSNINNVCNPKTDLGCGILKDASDIVISGGSAGALSVYLHADQWLDYIPNNQIRNPRSSSTSPSTTTTTTVVAIPDSGFFLDYNNVKINNQSWHDEMVWVVEAMNGTNSLPTLCLAANPTNRTRCFFAEHVSPFIQVPTFALQSEYDAYQVVAELHAQPSENTAINGYGQLLTNLIYTNLINTSNIHGMFLDSCYHHTRYWGDIIINQMNCAQSIQTWYNYITNNIVNNNNTITNMNDISQRVWFQNQNYPCTNCCTGGQ